jgi:hypothetical protein
MIPGGTPGSHVPLFLWIAWKPEGPLREALLVVRPPTQGESPSAATRPLAADRRSSALDRASSYALLGAASATGMLGRAGPL